MRLREVGCAVTDAKAEIAAVAEATVGGCLIGPQVIICSPTSVLGWRITYCPTCERRRKMLVRSAVWYGDDLTCLTCGDAWQDGEMMPRPFRPRWRQDRVQSARSDLARALPPRQHRAAVMEMVRRSFEEADE